MRSGGKPCWKTILLEGQGEVGMDVSRRDRLAALYRFQNGEAPAELRFVDPHGRGPVTDPAMIDWTHFPVLDALEAVTRDELERLRSLLRAETFTSTPPAPQAAPNPPSSALITSTPPAPQAAPNLASRAGQSAVWGLDLLHVGVGLPASPAPPSSTPPSDA